MYLKAMGWRTMTLLNILVVLFVGTSAFEGFWLSDWSADFKNQRQTSAGNSTLQQCSVTMSAGDGTLLPENSTGSGQGADTGLVHSRLIIYGLIGLARGKY